MKFLFVAAFLGLVAITLAGPLPDALTAFQGEKIDEPVKVEDVKDTRDKRGVLVTSYATAPISAPVAYTSFAGPAPVAYAGLPVSYVQSYPSVVGYNSYPSYVVV
ncbi:uncharacterized protein LOC117168244 [Belonocnema kinseyi]|uniref:uncharacterized protein LOC117168244 n=1 Tax=Belonocnema kinseyi TaxID=2817044 RepID=UPI00143D1A0B|nr:uncharacterized protein LOC117168244 [Belonocnema kinseyi]